MEYYGREEFLAERFMYRPGEHVAFFEPTQQGKSYLAYQMFDMALRRNPDLTAATLVPKPRDPAAAYWSQELGLAEIPTWPPPWRPFREKPRGYTLWPPHLRDADEATNDAYLAGIFRACLRDQYWKGSSITLVDDCYLAAVLMGLNPTMERHWTAGGGMGAALWTTDQKPSGTISGGSVSTFRLNSPTHLILGHDPDTRNIQRFSEIGGVNPKHVFSVAQKLRIHQINGKNVSEKLYIHKGGPFMCIIGPT
jgi:hypothetical protein